MPVHFKSFFVVMVGLTLAIALPALASSSRVRTGECPTYTVPPFDLQKLLETRVYYPLYLSSDSHRFDEGCECNWAEFQKPASSSGRITFSFNCVKQKAVAAATQFEGEIAVFKENGEENTVPGSKPEGRLRLRAKQRNGLFVVPFDILASADDLSWFIAYSCIDSFGKIVSENIRLLVSGDKIDYYNTKEGRQKLKKIMENTINNKVKGLKTESGIKFNETQKSARCGQKRAELAASRMPVSPR